MRENLYKAKTLNNKWVYGYLVVVDNVSFIIEQGTGFFDISCGENIFSTAYCREIIPETLCEYTNLDDKNKNRIFENDVFICGDKNIKYRVVFTEDCSFMGQQMNSINGKDTGCRIGLNYWKDKIEIIGNIHDKDLKG